MMTRSKAMKRVRDALRNHSWIPMTSLVNLGLEVYCYAGPLSGFRGRRLEVEWGTGFMQVTLPVSAQWLLLKQSQAFLEHELGWVLENRGAHEWLYMTPLGTELLVRRASNGWVTLNTALPGD